MPDFDFKEKFPIATYISGMIEKKKAEEAFKAAGRQSMLAGIDSIANTGVAYKQKRADDAQALSRAAILANQQPELADAFGMNRQVGTRSGYAEVPLPEGAQGPLARVPAQVPLTAAETLGGKEKVIASLANAIKGVSGDKFLEHLKPNTVDETIYLKDEKGNIIGTQTRKVPRGSKSTVVGPNTPRPAGWKLIEDPSSGSMIWVPPPADAGETSTGAQAPMGMSGPKTAPTVRTPIPVTAGYTKGEKKVDEDFAKTYNDFVNEGGFADVDRQVAGLDFAIDKLGKTNKGTGPLVGLLPKGARDVALPDSGAIEDQVRDVAQRNLRVILGGQFAQQEGEQLVRNTFNARLPEEENIRRLKNLRTQMKAALESKQQAAKHFQKHGSLRGFTGKTNWSISDFMQPGGGESGNSSTTSSSDPKARLEELRRKRDAGTLGK